MDIDPFKIVALISGMLAILDKLYMYGKSAYQALRKRRLEKRYRFAYDMNQPSYLIVERSLDLDLDVIISSIPPLESSYQHFGRINRHKYE